MFGLDFWIMLALAAVSIGFNLMQWIQQKIERGGLWHIKTAVNQLLARCNDAKQQGLAGLTPSDAEFINGMGHGLRSIERQIEDMLGLGLEHELHKRAGGRWRRLLRWLLPLAPIPYDEESPPAPAAQPPQES